MTWGAAIDCEDPKGRTRKLRSFALTRIEPLGFTYPAREFGPAGPLFERVGYVKPKGAESPISAEGL